MQQTKTSLLGPLIVLMSSIILLLQNIWNTSVPQQLCAIGRFNEMNEQFYVVLPSNSSLNIFQDNKTSSYKVQWPYPSELDITKWEVAISEIQFPNNFYTIRDRCNRIIKQYLSSSRDDLNYLYTNVESLSSIFLRVEMTWTICTPT